MIAIGVQRLRTIMELGCYPFALPIEGRSHDEEMPLCRSECLETMDDSNRAVLLTASARRLRSLSKSGSRLNPFEPVRSPIVASLEQRYSSRPVNSLSSLRTVEPQFRSLYTPTPTNMIDIPLIPSLRAPIPYFDPLCMIFLWFFSKFFIPV